MNQSCVRTTLFTELHFMKERFVTLCLQYLIHRTSFYERALLPCVYTTLFTELHFMKEQFVTLCLHLIHRTSFYKRTICYLVSTLPYSQNFILWKSDLLPCVYITLFTELHFMKERFVTLCLHYLVQRTSFYKRTICYLVSTLPCSENFILWKSDLLPCVYTTLFTELHSTKHRFVTLCPHYFTHSHRTAQYETQTCNYLVSYLTHVQGVVVSSSVRFWILVLGIFPRLYTANTNTVMILTNTI